MRLKSAIWVSAFLRRCMVEGIFGAVVRKGSEEAGAVHVIVNHLDGTCHLFAPAPGEAHDEMGERRWIAEISPPQTPADAMALLDRRLRFDPDLWIVEVEDRKGMAGLSATA
ncbi:DUF1491 family protein [Aestuariivirga sp.]|uniref:DUF1491 family protein n=1 Tax=Aestuariivirga sp. TaxID=2650926 RepID=UPI00301957DF